MSMTNLCNQLIIFKRIIINAMYNVDSNTFNIYIYKHRSSSPITAVIVNNIHIFTNILMYK